MKVYISGPMRSYPDLNFPAFDKAKRELEAAGHEAISPADMDRADGYSENDQRAFARRDLGVILECDAIYMLRGWERSLGASAELFVARWIGLQVINNEGMDLLVEDFCLENI